eukprot:COSAG01_NODE_5954_length_3937_cov_7.762376_7_plen_85_part_00
MMRADDCFIDASRNETRAAAAPPGKFPYPFCYIIDDGWDAMVPRAPLLENQPADRSFLGQHSSSDAAAASTGAGEDNGVDHNKN